MQVLRLEIRDALVCSRLTCMSRFPGFNLLPVQESKGVRFSPFTTKTANRTSPRGVASVQTSYLRRFQASIHG